MLRKTYNWVLHWAHTPYGKWALFILAFTESSFFPIPPDVLLIALAISIPKKAFSYAFICSVGSVLGGLFGYLIGYEFMELIGFPIIRFYGVMDRYEYVKQSFELYNAWIVFIAAFTPIPYKVITITAGACKVNLITFILASVVGRAARFYIVAGLIHYFGPKISEFIDRYFNVLSFAFVLLLILGFIVVKWLV